MPLHLSRAEPDMRVGIEIKRLNENEVSQAWRLLPSDLSGTVEVHVDSQGLTLAAITGDAHDKTPWGIEAPSANFLPADPAMPYVLRSFPVAPGGWQIGPAVSLPVFFTREGRVAWERWRAELLFALARTERPRLPLWSSQRMVRIVARNVFLQDAVGNFALGVAGLLQQSGIGAQVYAYNYADALAGLVRPISQLAKETAKMGEDAKIAIRNVRREAMDKAKALKKSGDLTEDEQSTMEEDVQKLTDKFIKLVDKNIEEKQKEIMSV